MRSFASFNLPPCSGRALLVPAATAILLVGLALLPLPVLAGPFELGMRMYERGDYGMAAGYLKTATLQNDTDANAHYYLADSYLKLNRLADAQAEYQKILAMAPDSQAARMSRIGLSRLRGILDGTDRPRWRSQGIGGSGDGAVDRYSGSFGEDNYLDEVTENGRMVRWDLTRMPLRIYIERSPKGIRNFQPAFIAQISKSMDVWTAALGHQLSYTLVDAPEKADIRMTWTNTIDTRGHSNDGGTSYTAGLTEPRITDSHLDFMAMKIATFDIKGKPQSADVIYAVAIHEFGHALGLLGHSDDPADIMYAQNQHVIKPSKRDLNTIRKLYAQAADVNNNDDVADRKIDPARAQELSGKLDVSVAKAEKLAKAEDTALNWLNLAVSYFLKGKDAAAKKASDGEEWYKKAINAIGETLHREPEDPRAYHRRSLVYQELRDYPHALSDIQTAMKYDRSNPEYFMLQSWFLANVGRKAEARGSLDTYLLMKPDAASSGDVKRIQEKLAQAQ